MPAGRRRYRVAQVSNLRAAAGGSAVRRAGACLLPHLSSRGSAATRDLVGAANASCARRAGRPVGRGFHAPPIGAINGAPPFHPNCVHMLTPFVDLSAGRKAERLATEEEKKRGASRPRC
jgi:hypothetical protein